VCSVPSYDVDFSSPLFGHIPNINCRDVSEVSFEQFCDILGGILAPEGEETDAAKLYKAEIVALRKLLQGSVALAFLFFS
jgi:hypothetical protein